MAAADERNFRSAYYEKVGCKSVEEKKSLKILLKDKTLDRSKLKQFCLRFSVPEDFRNLLWKVLLGVLPVHIECHPFIMEQRKQEYLDLVHALQVMRIIDNNFSKPRVYSAVWLLQTGHLRYDNYFNKTKGFTDIVEFLMQFYEDDTDIYWLAKSFYDNIRKLESEFPKLVEITFTLLEKEEPALYLHLHHTHILENLPIINWFECCFSNLLNCPALAKIWDKLCGGSCEILIYVVLTVLTTLKHNLMRCKTLEEVLLHTNKIGEEIADGICNKTIDMWHQHGSYLTLHDKPKS